MNMKQKGWRIEQKKTHAVGAKGAQLCTGLQTQPSPNAPYNVVNGNLRNFGGIFRHGADTALYQGAQFSQSRWYFPGWCKCYTNARYT